MKSPTEWKESLSQQLSTLIAQEVQLAGILESTKSRIEQTKGAIALCDSMIKDNGTQSVEPVKEEDNASVR